MYTYIMQTHTHVFTRHSLPAFHLAGSPLHSRYPPNCSSIDFPIPFPRNPQGGFKRAGDYSTGSKNLSETPKL